MPSRSPFIVFNELPREDCAIGHLLGHRDVSKNEFVLLSGEPLAKDLSIPDISGPLDVIADAIQHQVEREYAESDENITTETLPRIDRTPESKWMSVCKSDLIKEKGPHSWDSDVDSKTAFISEMPLTAFDNILKRTLEHSFSFKRMQSLVISDVLVESILCLSIGQDSPLYQYGATTQDVTMAVMDERILATTPSAVADSLTRPVACGAAFRRLDWSVARILNHADQYGLVGSAFAAALSECLAFLRSQVLVMKSHLSTANLVEISLQFTQLEATLTLLSDLCGFDEPNKGDLNLPFGAALINRLYTWSSQALEVASQSHFSIAFYLLKQSAVPYFRILENWLGLRSDFSTALFSDRQWREIDPYSEFFIQPAVDLETAAAQNRSYRIHHEIVMPFFLDHQEARKVLDCGRSFRLLSHTWPRHPLCNFLESENDDVPQLAIDIGLPPSKVRQQNVIFDFDSEPKHKTEDMVTSMEQQLRLFDIIADADDSTDIKDELQLMIDRLNEKEPISSLDIIVSQTVLAKIDHHCQQIHSTILSLFFGDLQLKFHLGLIRRFILMEDSNFVLGIRDAIFADGNNSREGGLGAGIGLGVRLKNRTTWPPGGAELSLALRTVLVDCMEDIKNNEQYAKLFLELDIQLSFAVKTLSETEMQACKNPQAIEALDFLYLDYKPIYPLNTIISPAIVQKYNRIFNYLLRLTRIQTVARQIHRMSQKAKGQDSHVLQLFSFEVQHFINSLHGYVNDVAIDLTWSQFMDRLQQLENRQYDESGIFGLQSLVEYHDHVLDRMLFQCLLRRKQQPIMSIIVGAFVVILGFGRALQHRHIGDKEDVVPIAKLHESFQGYVITLVKVLRNLEAKGGGKFGTGFKRDSSNDTGRQYHDRVDAQTGGMESFMHALLVRLDFNGFYTNLGDSK